MKFDFPKPAYWVDYYHTPNNWHNKVFFSKTSAIKFAREKRKRYLFVCISSMGVSYWL